MIVEEA